LEQARDAFRHAIETNGAIARAQYNLADLLDELGRGEEAIAGAILVSAGTNLKTVQRHKPHSKITLTVTRMATYGGRSAGTDVDGAAIPPRRKRAAQVEARWGRSMSLDAGR